MTPQSASDRALVEQVRALKPDWTLDHLDDRALAAIGREHGFDVATALLYQRARASPRHTMLAARLCGPAPISFAQDLVVGVVPGAFYDRHPHTGADGERVITLARAHDFLVERINTIPFADAPTNGSIIASWIQSHADAGRRVALVSLSKGTMDAAAGVRLIDAKIARSIAGWLSLSGLWNGTALVDWLDRRPLRRLLMRGVMAVSRRPFATVATLRRTHTPPEVPAIGGRIISVVGTPLRSHLRHCWAPSSYDKLAEFGPSDGGGLILADIRHAPGEIMPLWGVDHYLDPSWDVSPLISRLLLEAVRPVADDAIGTQPATAPHASPSTPPASKSMA